MLIQYFHHFCRSVRVHQRPHRPHDHAAPPSLPLYTPARRSLTSLPPLFLSHRNPLVASPLSSLSSDLGKEQDPKTSSSVVLSPLRSSQPRLSSPCPFVLPRSYQRSTHRLPGLDPHLSFSLLIPRSPGNNKRWTPRPDPLLRPPSLSSLLPSLLALQSISLLRRLSFPSPSDRIGTTQSYVSLSSVPASSKLAPRGKRAAREAPSLCFPSSDHFQTLLLSV